MDMRTSIEGLAEEAEQQVRDHTWEPAPTDRTVAAKAAADLHAAIGSPHTQEALSAIDRLECLREALAVLATAVASVHGRLAWFLGAASTVLTPVLHWRALPAEDGFTFGALRPTPEQYTEAEDAIRRLHTALAHITAP
ncbi:hypothetical protein ACFY15_16550 [Streptomyces sp. NPDC001373]|uniref:hypothetical protein n=1 Tax=Streptomyces sp. NPDC001373 TaxID=3364565 RepID=UPI0036D17FC5